MRLWIDDIRQMPSWYDIWAKSADEAIDVIKHGNISAISLDHDLADGKDGIAICNWLKEAVLTGQLKNCPLIQIHTSNAVGKANMIQALKKITDCKTIDVCTILAKQMDYLGQGYANFIPNKPHPSDDKN